MEGVVTHLYKYFHPPVEGLSHLSLSMRIERGELVIWIDKGTCAAPPNEVECGKFREFVEYLKAHHLIVSTTKNHIAAEGDDMLRLKLAIRIQEEIG